MLLAGHGKMPAPPGLTGRMGTREVALASRSAAASTFGGTGFRPVVALSSFAAFDCAAGALRPWTPPRTVPGPRWHGRNGLAGVFGSIFALAKKTLFARTETFP